MEIAEFIKAKQQLEEDLLTIVRERCDRFKSEMGYSVTSVEVAMNGYNVFGAQPESIVEAVFVTVRIPGMGRQ